MTWHRAGQTANLRKLNHPRSGCLWERELSAVARKKRSAFREIRADVLRRPRNTLRFFRATRFQTVSKPFFFNIGVTVGERPRNARYASVGSMVLPLA